VTTSKQVVAGKTQPDPQTLNQKLYLERSKSTILYSASAGRNREDVSGCEHAVRALTEKKVNRIVPHVKQLRPASGWVFFQAHCRKRSDPYLKPLYDALYGHVDVERVDRHLERAPLKSHQLRLCVDEH